VYKNQLSWQTGSRNLTGPKTLPTIWHSCMKLVTKYQISAIDSCWEKCDNYWWHKSDIWSQASYRYPITWEAFLDPSDSYFLFADFVDFYTDWTYYKRQLSRQTGSRNLTGQKTHPTKWGTYMKLVTKYQISAINFAEKNATKNEQHTCICGGIISEH
jgi:hypothetical protein